MSTCVSAFSENNPVGYSDLLILCSNTEELRIFLLKSGLLGDRSGLCEICKKGYVYLTKKEGTFYWKCGSQACRKTISLRKGSFFEGSRLEFKQILCLIYCWIYQLPHDFIKAERILLTDTSIVDWKNFCREVCIDILVQDNKKIGGRGKIVEVDESKFGRRKYNRGRRVEGCWVLGGIDRDSRETFFEIIEDRSKETLVPILIKYIHPETTVITDCWKSYDKLYQHFKEHKNVNHSLHFVDPNDRKLHTNTIESQWRVLKRNVLPKNGTNHSLYSSYFSMYCVQRRYLNKNSVPCRFKAFLELIKRAYPLDAVQHTPRKDLRSSEENVSDTASVHVNEPSESRPHAKRVKRPLLMEWSDDDDFQ